MTTKLNMFPGNKYHMTRTTPELPTDDLVIWCDSCYTWVEEVEIYDAGISCAACHQELIRKKLPREQKRTRSALARAIWGL
jgi:hypothetical protein